MAFIIESQDVIATAAAAVVHGKTDKDDIKRYSAPQLPATMPTRPWSHKAMGHKPRAMSHGPQAAGPKSCLQGHKPRALSLKGLQGAM